MNQTSTNYLDVTSDQVMINEDTEESCSKREKEDCGNEVSTVVDDELASQIAMLLTIDTDGSTDIVNKGIESDLLTRLDELHGMLDMIKSDSFVLVNEFIPTLHAKMKELRPIFDQIDQLEKFTNKVKSDIAVVEKDLSNADSFGSLQALKKVFSGISLFGQKKQSTESYNPPTVFKTSDFMHVKDQHVDQAS